MIDLKPKENKTIDVWKNMTVSEVASATGIPVGKLLIHYYFKIIDLSHFLNLSKYMMAYNGQKKLFLTVDLKVFVVY